MESQRDNTDHARANLRNKLFQPAKMSIAGNTQRVHLLNLSVGGALIYVADPPQRGTSLHVQCGDRLLLASVAWSGDRRFGVKFTIPLTRADVDKTIADHDAHVSAAFPNDKVINRRRRAPSCDRVASSMMRSTVGGRPGAQISD